MPLTTLCYIKNKSSYLMIHRTKKKNDINEDKWIGIGGHFEKDESPEECLLREVKEETGLTLLSWELRGIVTFISDRSGSEYMFLYTSDSFAGDPGKLPSCREGELVWIPIKDVRSLKLWEGDRVFLDLLEGGSPFFSLKLCYCGDELSEAVLNGRKII